MVYINIGMSSILYFTITIILFWLGYVVSFNLIIKDIFIKNKNSNYYMTYNTYIDSVFLM